ITAEKVDGKVLGTEEMKMGGQYAQDAIRRADHEELQRGCARRARRDSGGVAIGRRGVEEGPEMKMAANIDEMQASRRGVGAVTILSGRVIRRKETGEHDSEMQGGEREEIDCQLAPVRHRALVSVRILGSAQ